MGPTDRIGRYARTVTQLRAAQVAQRIRLRAQRVAVSKAPDLFTRRWRVPVPDTVGLPEPFSALDRRHQPACGTFTDLASGTFTHLNETRALGPSVAWDPDGATHLWLFHHHYWEWAWTLSAHPDRAAAREVFARQWTGWRAHATFGRQHAWAAYPTSLRAWVLVNVFADLVDGTPIEEDVVADISLHAGFLVHNLELDVGGNHVVKNIKGLLGCAVFLRHDGLVQRALDLLRREIDVQVLADGGHYELSPSYHCQVLGDLVDMAQLLAADGRPAVPALDDAIAVMRT